MAIGQDRNYIGIKYGEDGTPSWLEFGLSCSVHDL